MTNLEKLDEVIRLTVLAARSSEPTTIDYAELVERRNRLVHELRAALAAEKLPGVAPSQTPSEPVKDCHTCKHQHNAGSKGACKSCTRLWAEVNGGRWDNWEPAHGVTAPVRTWQHDETGRITQTAECPGPRWVEVPAGVAASFNDQPKESK